MDAFEETRKNIAAITPYAFAEDGKTLLTLREQRDLQNEVLAWTGDKASAHKPFVISMSGVELGISRLADLPILIRHSDISHIFKHHAQDTRDGQLPMSMRQLLAHLDNLPKELKDNVFAYDDPNNENKLCIVLGEKSRSGNELIAVINIAIEIAHVEVADIITVHGRRDLFKQIEDAVLLGRNTYLNEKTDGWIKSSTEKPREITNRLLEFYHKNPNQEPLTLNKETLQSYAYKKPRAPKNKTTHKANLSTDAKVAKTASQKQPKKSIQFPKPTKGAR